MKEVKAVKIAKTEYYIRMTEFLRADGIRDKVTFFDDGFTYMSRTLAISFERESKSNYRVVIICPENAMQQTYSNIAGALADVRELVIFENPDEAAA